jgi:hypothetical protein
MWHRQQHVFKLLARCVPWYVEAAGSHMTKSQRYSCPDSSLYHHVTSAGKLLPASLWTWKHLMLQQQQASWDVAAFKRNIPVQTFSMQSCMLCVAC